MQHILVPIGRVPPEVRAVMYFQKLFMDALAPVLENAAIAIRQKLPAQIASAIKTLPAPIGLAQEIFNSRQGS